MKNYLITTFKSNFNKTLTDDINVEKHGCKNKKIFKRLSKNKKPDPTDKCTTPNYPVAMLATKDFHVKCIEKNNV